MSNGYLIVANKNIADLSKNRYMKFEPIAAQGNLYGYGRMEYLNGKCQLVDVNRIAKNSLCLSEYGVRFFEQLGRENIYFSYVLLTKHITMADVIAKAVKAIKANAKIPALFLHGTERPEIEQDQLYRIASKPPDQGRKSWRR